MKRKIILDTETTGLSPENGDSVIEIGCVEVMDDTITGKQFHWYIQPDCRISEEAVQVHGITNEFLKDKPRFKDIAGDFCDCIRGAEIIAHNAPFDIGFLNAELKRIHLPDVSQTAGQITDTLPMAKQHFPRLRNNLDSLCDRFRVDRSCRTNHGALLDAQLLAEVYLKMQKMI